MFEVKSFKKGGVNVYYIGYDKHGQIYEKECNDKAEYLKLLGSELKQLIKDGIRKCRPVLGYVTRIYLFVVLEYWNEMNRRGKL
jgi:hypothetical protein